MKKLIRLHLLAAVFLILAIACQNSQVMVSKTNPHYFSYKNKPLVLITSDHHYGGVIDMDFDYEKFLDYLADNELNLTRIYPGGMFEAPDKYLKGNPLGPQPGRQLLPWSKSSQTGANPLLAESVKPSYKYDLDSWNPGYFARLKAFVEYSKKKNIIVEIVFFNGMYNDSWPLMAMNHENNIQNIGQYETKDCGLFTSNDNRNLDVINYQKAYIQKITTELNDFDNLIFDICDEPSLQGLPGGSVLLLPDSQVIPWIETMKEAFLLAEKKLPKKHILGQTIQNLSPDLSNESWCNWLPTEYVKTAEKALNLNYKNNKPIVDVESNYFGCTLTKNPYTADAVRLEGWWFILGGGAGCINLNGEFYRGQELGGSITQNQIVPQRKVLKNFMDNLDLSALSRYTNFSGTPTNAFCNALADNGKQYAFYLFHGAFESEWGSHFMPKPGNYQDKLIFNSIPEGKYEIEWIDPASGTKMSTEKLNWNGGNLNLKSPVYLLDIAGRINRIK